MIITKTLTAGIYEGKTYCNGVFYNFMCHKNVKQGIIFHQNGVWPLCIVPQFLTIEILPEQTICHECLLRVHFLPHIQI